jgi:hypothetical protein
MNSIYCYREPVLKSKSFKLCVSLCTIDTRSKLPGNIYSLVQLTSFVSASREYAVEPVSDTRMNLRDKNPTFRPLNRKSKGCEFVSVQIC